MKMKGIRMKKLLFILAVIMIANASQELNGNTVVCIKSNLAMGGADQQVTCYRHLNVVTMDDYHCYIRLDGSQMATRAKIAGAPSNYLGAWNASTIGTGLNMTSAGKLTSASGDPVGVALDQNTYTNYQNARQMYAVPANANQKSIGSAFGTSAQIATSAQDAMARLGSSLCQ